jgi:hypothetical protein
MKIAADAAMNAKSRGAKRRLHMLGLRAMLSTRPLNQAKPELSFARRLA